jgi:hypothetical protein
VVALITNEPRDPGEAGADENKKFTQIRTLETKYEVVKGGKTIDSNFLTTMVTYQRV